MSTNGEYVLPSQSDDELTVTAETGGAEYPDCPVGAWASRCVDVVYRGKEANKFEPSKPPQHKISLHFLIDAYNDDDTPARRTDGKRFVLSIWFTRSMHAKSNLRQTLAAWRGRDFDDAQAEVFNLNDLVGKDCLVNVKLHKTLAGDNKVIIGSIGRLPRGMQPCGPEEYTRLRDRASAPAGDVNPGSASPGQWRDVPPVEDEHIHDADNEDLPF